MKKKTKKKKEREKKGKRSFEKLLIYADLD